MKTPWKKKIREHLSDEDLKEADMILVHKTPKGHHVKETDSTWFWGAEPGLMGEWYRAGDPKSG